MPKKTDINDPKKLKLIRLKVGNPKMSMKKLGELIGVHEDTIFNWLHSEEVRDAIFEEAKALLDGEVPKILEAQKKRAIKGSLMHAELILGLLNRYQRTQKIELSGKIETGCEGMSPEELTKKAAEIAARQEERA